MTVGVGGTTVFRRGAEIVGLTRLRAVARTIELCRVAALTRRSGQHTRAAAVAHLTAGTAVLSVVGEADFIDGVASSGGSERHTRRRIGALRRTTRGRCARCCRCRRRRH